MKGCIEGLKVEITITVGGRRAIKGHINICLQEDCRESLNLISDGRSATFLILEYLSVKCKVYLAFRFETFHNSSRRVPGRYKMKKRIFLATLLIFFMVEGCTMFAKSVDAPRMTKEELKAMLGNPDLFIMDVRFGKDWTESDLKIKGAVREDPEAFDSWANKYPKDKTLVFYCA